MNNFISLILITSLTCFTINSLPSENKSKKRTFSQALTLTFDFQQPTKKPRLKNKLSTTIENFKQDSYQEQYTDLKKNLNTMYKTSKPLKKLIK